ncbi:uncharacterized protein PAF06_009714 [Gastrophryne carolinensis]
MNKHILLLDRRLSAVNAVLLAIPVLWILKRAFLPYLWQDFQFFLRTFRYIKSMTQEIRRCPTFSVLDIFLKQVKTRPNHPFILYQDESYTYKEIDVLSNQAAWALRYHAQLKTGDCVALFMGNQPAYVWLWMALAKLGCPMACLNYNIRAKSFLHCFKCSGARVLITTPELRAAVEEVLPALIEGGVMIFYLSQESPNKDMRSLLDKVEAASQEPIPSSFTSHLTKDSPALYIYTSGTTGLPKAVMIPQFRVLMSSAITTLAGVTPKDIIYVTLPLYHSSGLLIGIRGCIQQGATCVIRSKFSVSQFWNDCRKYNVTVFLYIGEVLRYLCNTPKKDNDKDHCVRIALGNGLRADVWREFISRFGPIQIKEFFGATESNPLMFNIFGKIGAIGRWNTFIKARRPFELIKYDVENEKPARDASGRCIRAQRGETGLFVTKNTPINNFCEYMGDESETEKKRLRDVFERGDIYFNSGDMLMIDNEGFVYFQDRVGDTFRWKGENVATTEVADIIVMTDFIEEANVYGVQVPYHEGRIGMAAIKLKEGHAFDGEKLYGHVVDYLPSYARPRFIRIQDAIDITGTFKQRKVELVKEGFNPLTIKDPLYILDDTSKRYKPMTQETYDDILEDFRCLTKKDISLDGVAELDSHSLALNMQEHTMSLYRRMSAVKTALLAFPVLWMLKRIFIPYLWQDLVFFLKVYRYFKNIEQALRRCPSFNMLDLFLKQVAMRPDHTFILYQDESYTYKEIDLKSNQAAWALRYHAQLKKGDTVAIFMGNQPAYIWLWLALAKLGCPMACLNYNIRSKSFLHCFNCCKAKVLIAAPELREAVEEVLPTLAEEGVMVFYLSRESPTERCYSLLEKVEAASQEPIPKSFTSHLTKQTPALYIYTSGTTGLPKAAIISQGRLLVSSTLTTIAGVTYRDIIYIPLPLYHSAGLIIGVRGCIQQGATFVLRNKFSASQFWDDCRKYNVTVFQYIGEIMRYLCNTPKKDNDKDHRVRMAIGNGLRPDVWKEFISRFGPIQINEFYAATESNTFLFNYTGKIGAAGRCNMFLRSQRPFELIKYDVEKDEPVRDASGHCIRVPIGEAGLLVSKITPATPFSGYAGDQSLTEKKRLRDVFEKEDVYFNSGDLLTMDREGFMYFQDRVGDTFRWKGENVATTEVADIIGMTDFIEEANVYGVPVPYHEGRIGMAAIKLKEDHLFDRKKLYGQVADYLPTYARPYFVRIQDSIEVTGTFKQCKVNLIKEGFNPLTIKDPLYFLDETNKQYKLMTQDHYNDILANKIKL